MATARHRIVSAIFEPDGPGGFDYPVVVHVFCGQTPEEALGYFNAHLGTDEFFRDCVERGSFRGKFSCVAETVEERLTAAGWKPA